MKTVIISCTNDIVNDQRVIRTASTFGKLGWKVILVGRQFGDSLPDAWIPHKVIRFRMLFKKGPLFYMFFNIRLWFYLMTHANDLIWSNDLDTLPAGYLTSCIRQRPLVYDMHEYFTGVPELIHRKVTRRIWEKIESTIFPKLKNVITVSPSIAREFESRYPVPVAIVRNVPKPFTNDKSVPIDLRFADGKLILYQGTMNKERGLEFMIRAMLWIENARFILVGDGPEKKKLEGMIRELGLHNRVRMIPRMLPHQLQKLTPQADLGISIERNIGLNYRFALPNKLFDYIYAGVPVLVSSLTEMQRIIEKYKVGWILESYDPERMAAQVNLILKDLERDRSRLQGNLKRASGELNWEIEEPKLIDFIQSVN